MRRAIAERHDTLTVAELEQRWINALITTRAAVVKHPGEYRQLKALAGDIVTKTVDINDYLPAAKKLAELLRRLDPGGKGTIFRYFNDRIAPSSVWDVCWLRLECKDLLAHLTVFDKWRLQNCHLQILK